MAAEIVAVALGVLVGLSLGALGGGGSTLAVPILVFVAGMQAQDATTASLLVVGVAATIGAVRHLRLGNVRLGVGLAFGAAGIVGSRVGTTINRSLDEHVLLLAFSALILFVAVRMHRSARPLAPLAPAPVDRVEPLAAAPASGATVVLVARPEASPRRHLDRSVGSVGKLVLAASAVGLLTGLFGVGGGFAVVPALTLLLGFEAKEAIGTSLVVIAMNAGIALALRSGHLDLDWGLVLPFLVTVTAGVLVGSGVARRFDSVALTRAFAVMLGAVAVYTAAGTLLA